MKTINPASEAEVLAQAAAAIQPKLALLEGRRRAYLVLTRLVVAGIFAMGAIGALLLWALAGGIAGLFVLGGGFVFAGIAYLACLKLYKGSARGEVVPPLAEAMGLSYSRDAPGFDATGLQALGVLPASHRLLAANLVQGRHRDTAYRMAEVLCWNERTHRTRAGRTGHRREVLWQGLVVEIEVPVAFAGPVVLARDRGSIRNAFEGNAVSLLKRVAVPDPAFEKVFEVHAADPAEAERLLAPALRESLVALSRARPGRALGAAFVGGRFLLAVPVKSFLAQGRLNQPAETLLQELPLAQRELSLPQRVIDYLYGERPGPLL